MANPYSLNSVAVAFAAQIAGANDPHLEMRLSIVLTRFVCGVVNSDPVWRHLESTQGTVKGVVPCTMKRVSAEAGLDHRSSCAQRNIRLCK